MRMVVLVFELPVIPPNGAEDAIADSG
jgi:hypothetical protein